MSGDFRRVALGLYRSTRRRVRESPKVAASGPKVQARERLVIAVHSSSLVILSIRPSDQVLLNLGHPDSAL